MLSNSIGKKVTCSYRTTPQHPWIGVVIAPDETANADRIYSEAHWCELGNRTPIQYPFGKMLDSDESLTVIENT